MSRGSAAPRVLTASLGEDDRPPTRPAHPPTPQPGLPRHPGQGRVGRLRSILFTGRLRSILFTARDPPVLAGSVPPWEPGDEALRWRMFGKQVIYDNRGCASLAWTYRHRKAIGPSTTLSDCNVSLWLLSATFETEFSSCGGVGS